MNKLTPSQVSHLASLASLPLTPQQEKHFAKDLTSILESVQKIQTLDLASVPPTNQVTNTTNQFRADTLTPSLTQEQALSNSNHTHNGYFVVPRLIDNGQ